ncbi:hypothetical protein BH18ACT11_BH18ACT11_09260 [soil metagenome]
MLLKMAMITVATLVALLVATLSNAEFTARR